MEFLKFCLQPTFPSLLCNWVWPCGHILASEKWRESVQLLGNVLIRKLLILHLLHTPSHWLEIQRSGDKPASSIQTEALLLALLLTVCLWASSWRCGSADSQAPWTCWSWTAFKEDLLMMHIHTEAWDAPVEEKVEKQAGRNLSLWVTLHYRTTS